MRRLYSFGLGLLAVVGAAGCILAVTHAQSDGSAAPVPAATAAVRQTPLDTLDWLAGDWVDASGGLTAEFSCHFTKNNAFLIRSFRIVTKKDVRMSGMQVIVWDPAQETIRSWTYDSDGGFGEETWSQSGNRYTIRAKYTLPDGGTGSALHVLTYVDGNRCTWKSVNREIDGAFQPDTDEIVIVRKPISTPEKGGEQP
jgi:hypothetical protein